MNAVQAVFARRPDAIRKLYLTGPRIPRLQPLLKWCVANRVGYRVVDDEAVTIAILDHPDNVGYPTYWHARDYGLFAANPLGQKDLSEGEEELNFRLDAGGSVTFRHRIAVFDGAVEDEVVENEWASFAE